MENSVRHQCPNCGGLNEFCVAEDASETDAVTCSFCGHPMATVGQLHAQIAQEAIGLGATELRDDHVPLDGELGERPRR